MISEELKRMLDAPLSVQIREEKLLKKLLGDVAEGFQPTLKEIEKTIKVFKDRKWQDPLPKLVNFACHARHPLVNELAKKNIGAISIDRRVQRIYASSFKNLEHIPTKIFIGKEAVECNCFTTKILSDGTTINKNFNEIILNFQKKIEDNIKTLKSNKLIDKIPKGSREALKKQFSNVSGNPWIKTSFKINLTKNDEFHFNPFFEIKLSRHRGRADDNEVIKLHCDVFSDASIENINKIIISQFIARAFFSELHKNINKKDRVAYFNLITELADTETAGDFFTQFRNHFYCNRSPEDIDVTLDLYSFMENKFNIEDKYYVNNISDNEEFRNTMKRSIEQLKNRNSMDDILSEEIEVKPRRSAI